MDILKLIFTFTTVVLWIDLSFMWSNVTGWLSILMFVIFCLLFFPEDNDNGMNELFWVVGSIFMFAWFISFFLT
jgi:hypothetical protein